MCVWVGGWVCVCVSSTGRVTTNQVSAVTVHYHVLRCYQADIAFLTLLTTGPAESGSLWHFNGRHAFLVTHWTAIVSVGGVYRACLAWQIQLSVGRFYRI